ncbi:glycosyltransferase family 4 protein [Sulfurimonas sp. HSL3-7]|uniref:glycosyltransferase family 4 protein n=1 Tax=Sulfonitrofixus jiaomeiensis TaxID=3131938 RepID=UPI0031F99248
MWIAHANFAKGFRGGERQTQLLIEQLAQQGYKQKLLTRIDSELAQRCSHIKHLEIIPLKKPYIFHSSVVKGATLLHAHETKALQFAYFAHLLYNMPYIVTRRVDNPLKTNFLNKKMYAAAFKSVALSKAIENEVLRVSPEAKTAIIPSAFSDITVNEKVSAMIKERFKGKFLIGNVGALVDSHKGQSLLIEAAKGLEKNHPELHFILLGRGEDEEKFKEQAKGLKNITFEGFVDNVNDYISCFDLFLFPSRHEGLGSILLDVMQLNVPVIATDVGGIPDIIKSEYNGLLIPPASAEAIVNSIIDLYKHPEKRALLAAHAKETVKNYSPSAMAKRYIGLYGTVQKEA